MQLHRNRARHSQRKATGPMTTDGINLSLFA